MRRKTRSKPRAQRVKVPPELRECFRVDGTPKRVYSCQLAAELDITDPLKHAYKCSKGHWHIGRRQNLDHPHVAE